MILVLCCIYGLYCESNGQIFEEKLRTGSKQTCYAVVNGTETTEKNWYRKSHLKFQPNLIESICW